MLQATNIPVFDAFTIPNSLNPAHPAGIVPAFIDSLRIRWSGVAARIHFSDATDKFAGTFVENSATIEVTATTPPNATLGTHGFHFVSDAASTTVSHFAQIGKERNGVFFNREDDDDDEHDD